ncbi:response regulator transcription factor [Mucilaginibacter myungsuensis]|uniref:Response regulator transcription factor n=1 Tax=Mucilaginibacter myungsuensis TaxID=649104 RepID=A0A929KY98_9SPHI|nr:response regulator transcription factor [Mucilaginibacter myungsuensis]MBE9661109.1 response regulator transcription factor [Mucilaginibacter myungsuensis]MDN3597253.1 response regulator transcription factor [Mucilaginibacter myungsuensis]
MDNATVLLAEDELSLSHIVRESLEERGYKVTLCPNGKAALEKYQDKKPDILVLDVMMPLMDGFEVARQIRIKDKQTPIIFLTARSQAKDVVAGFELGANDYLKKPFSVEELIVRIKVQLSRTGTLDVKPSKEKESFRFGEFTFTPHKNALQRGANLKLLTSRESEILELLYRNQQQITGRDDILNKLWGSDSFFNARSLDVFITKLRKYLSADPSVQIINIRGQGYKLVY